MHRLRVFAGPRARTVGTSLIHSCAPELTRQGIWLPFSREVPLPSIYMGQRDSPVKRVRVTPGLQRRFAGLYPGFTDRQWPGFSPRTHPFGLAGTYVFIKQSGPPRHCDPRSRGFLPPDRGHPFSRSYGANLPSSLARVIPQTPGATHPGAPVSVLGTDAGDRSRPPFHGPPESAEDPIRGPIPGFGPFSPLRFSRAFTG